ncbi:MAG: HNH endonuclease signature motif containing protein [Acidimicrobiales bacterium]
MLEVAASSPRCDRHHDEYRADRYQVVVRVDADVLTGDNPTGSAMVDGGDATAETARRLCCDGSVIRLYENVDGQPVAVSAKTRTVPAAHATGVARPRRLRRFPGCTHRGWLDAHHQHHRADGGPTNLDNLLLCRRHHRTVHEGGWTVHRSDGGRAGRSPTPTAGALCSHPPPNPTTSNSASHTTSTPRREALLIDRPHYPYIIFRLRRPPTAGPQWN